MTKHKQIAFAGLNSNLVGFASGGSVGNKSLFNWKSPLSAKEERNVYLAFLDQGTPPMRDVYIKFRFSLRIITWNIYEA